MLSLPQGGEGTGGKRACGGAGVRTAKVVVPQWFGLELWTLAEEASLPPGCATHFQFTVGTWF